MYGYNETNRDGSDSSSSGEESVQVNEDSQVDAQIDGFVF
jgi:hypothetical protein